MYYDFTWNDNDELRAVRRAVKNNKKKKKFIMGPRFKYGVQIPRNAKEAYELDKANGNDFWAQAIKKEINALVDDLKCFEFKPAGETPGPGYQRTTLVMIFDVKHDLRHKARLVAGGHLVDVLDNSVYSSTVKTISVHLLHVIAHKHKLEQLCGDVGNAFVNAYTNEKVFAIAGPEFGKEQEGQVVIIVKALYGLATSAERWHSHFADFLRSLGFRATRYDQDVWFRTAKDGKSYEYICTHVDDFMIVAKEPKPIMKCIQDSFTVKSVGPPDYYLGNDYKKDSKGHWNVGCKKYLSEALSKVQEMFGPISKESTPLPSNDHPEEDTSEILNAHKHRRFQMLIGMLNWIVSIGRFDVAYAVASMARFVACPREGHLKRAVRIFGYLKKHPNRRIKIDSRDPEYVGSEEVWKVDLSLELQGCYPDAFEEIDTKLPKPLVPEMDITVLVDSDHAHDKVTRRSITGLLIFLGRTPV